MNKKGDESTGIMTGIAIIVIALVALLFTNSTLFASTKEAAEGFFGSKGESLKIVQDIYNKDKIDEQNEIKAKDEIAALFNKLGNVNGDDCIYQTDFNILNKRFNVNVDGKKLIIKETVREYYEEVKKPVYYFYGGLKNEKPFTINEFSDILDGELSNFVYIANNNIYLLDQASAADFTGKYSPVFKKNICGQNDDAAAEKLKLSPVEGSSIDLGNYFNKANSDFILNLHNLKRLSGEETSFFGGVEHNRIILINYYEKKIEEWVNYYFNFLYTKPNCWKFILFLDGSLYGKKLYIFKNIDTTKGFERTTVDLIKGSEKIGQMSLLVSDECRKV